MNRHFSKFAIFILLMTPVAAFSQDPIAQQEPPQNQEPVITPPELLEFVQAKLP